MATVKKSNQEFVHFLMKEGALVRFVRNRKKHAEIYYDNYVFIPPSATDSIDNIKNAFYWFGSPEGYDYWNELNEKWLELSGFYER